jgi:Flp pilus assembly protein protease CpaA
MRTLLPAVAIGLLVFAGYSDLRYRRIPNGVCLAIAVIGLARLIIDADAVAAGYTLGAGAAVFAVTFVLFLCGVFGGGDAKLLTAVGLLVGYRNLIGFLIIMSLCGGVLGLFALARAKLAPSLERVQIGLRLTADGFAPTNRAGGSFGLWLGRLPLFTKSPLLESGNEAEPARPTVPYGIAIAAGGIATLILQSHLTR